jgi:Zn-dependent peptidase ImmA (M78 family)
MFTLEDIKAKYKDIVPVPIVQIAKDLGIKIIETDEFEKTQSGSITRHEDGFVIYLNRKNSPKRKRFTIAHEIAHFLKHRSYLNAIQEHIDDDKTAFQYPSLNRMSTLETLSEDAQKRECEANKIAAELLMPEARFKEIWEESSNLDEVADRFDVSTSAASIRAKELIGIYVV